MLFVAQRHHRIDARGAARRHIAGQHCNHGQDQCRRTVDQRIAGTDFKQHSRHQPRDIDRRKEPDSDSSARQQQSLPQNQPAQVRTACSQGQANTEFLSALRHRVRDHTIGTDYRKRQCRQREQAHQLRR